MDRTERAAGPRRRPHGGAAALLLLAVMVAPAAAACAPHAPDGSGTAAAMPTMAPSGGAAAPAAAELPAGVVRVDAAAMWAARPDFVRADATTEAAYHYAIEHPEVVAWMPCYCGCDAMEHRSNLDCYLKARAAAFEEHASYCRICVDITLKAKELVAGGKNLREVRTIVDATWGGIAPGTRTALPPA
jgi:Protein of unknown function with PCYCGC motif